MGKMIDITGKVFGRLTVIGPAPKPENSKSTHRFWLCQCICQNVVVVNGSKLRNGQTQSCGCLQKERASQASTTHGLSNSKLNKIYFAMKHRCYNPNSDSYKNYGARGIKICSEWLDKENGFINFYNWSMLHGYKEGLTIDRISNDGNYEPSNCRWETRTIQSFNQRHRSNKTGHTGIKKSKNGKYEARIRKNKKDYYLGTFSTIEAAVEARERAERELYT